MFMQLKIKSNEELFNKFKILGNSVILLSCMVQNDMLVDDTEIEEWNNHFKNTLKSLKDLHKETLDYLSKVNV